jgi:hypothetical protein
MTWLIKYLSGVQLKHFKLDTNISDTEDGLLPLCCLVPTVAYHDLFGIVAGG